MVGQPSLKRLTAGSIPAWGTGIPIHHSLSILLSLAAPGFCVGCLVTAFLGGPLPAGAVTQSPGHQVAWPVPGFISGLPPTPTLAVTTGNAIEPLHTVPKEESNPAMESSFSLPIIPIAIVVIIIWAAISFIRRRRRNRPNSDGQ